MLIGAVKSNLGHLEAAAGIAGFIKTVLAVQRGHIPSNLGFNTPNPHIPFDEMRLKVVAEQPGLASGGACAAGGGVVVRFRWDECTCGGGAGPGVGCGVVRGWSCGVIRWWCRVSRWRGWGHWRGGVGRLDGSPVGAAVGLADVAHTLNHHRARYALFGTVCARDRGSAVAGLRALAAGVRA